jgi:hypothetical protein
VAQIVPANAAGDVMPDEHALGVLRLHAHGAAGVGEGFLVPAQFAAGDGPLQERPGVLGIQPGGRRAVGFGARPVAELLSSDGPVDEEFGALGFELDRFGEGVDGRLPLLFLGKLAAALIPLPGGQGQMSGEVGGNRARDHAKSDRRHRHEVGARPHC